MESNLIGQRGEMLRIGKFNAEIQMVFDNFRKYSQL